MLKFLAKVAVLSIAAGIGINAVAIMLSGGSFELTARNWSLAISISVIGTMATAASLGISLWRLKSR